MFCKEARARARILARSEQRAPLSAAAANGGIAPLLPRRINGFHVLPRTTDSPLILFRSLSCILLPSTRSSLPLSSPACSQVMSSLSSTKAGRFTSRRARARARLYIVPTHMNTHTHTLNARADSVRPLHETQQVQKGDTHRAHTVAVGARARDEREEGVKVEGLRRGVVVCVWKKEPELKLSQLNVHSSAGGEPMSDSGCSLVTQAQQGTSPNNTVPSDSSLRLPDVFPTNHSALLPPSLVALFYQAPSLHPSFTTLTRSPPSRRAPPRILSRLHSRFAECAAAFG